jgi:transcriptional regulator with XRE-family HTH domain
MAAPARSRMRRQQADGSLAAASAEANVPQVGEVIRKLRRQRGLSLRAVAEAAQLSASFLGAVERGESDISVGRVALVARALGHDVASLLGYSIRQSRPLFIRREERVRLRRGKGIDLTAMRIPGTSLEMLIASLPPHSKDVVVTHAGIDVLLVVDGELVLEVDGVDYAMVTGDCAVWPSSHRHAIRNDSDTLARAIGLVTETAY